MEMEIPSKLNICNIDEDILFYIANHLKLCDIENFGKSCSLFYQICNNPNSIHYLSFYQDALSTDQPFSHSKFNKIHKLVYNDNIEALNTEIIKKYWIDKAIEIKQKNEIFGSFFQNENDNPTKLDLKELCFICIEEIQKLDDNTIKNKLINRNWQNSIRQLKVYSLSTFFEERIIPLLPKTFYNLQSLQLENIKNETILIEKGFKSLVKLDVALRIYGASGYMVLFHCILNCKHLQHLKLTGNGQKQLSELINIDWNNEDRKLYNLRSICLLQMDITPKLCQFYEYLIINTSYNKLRLQFEPNMYLNNNALSEDIGNSIGNILLCSKIDITKIASLCFNVFESKCWDLLQKLLNKLKKPTIHCLQDIIFTLEYNEQLKDGFTALLPNMLLDIMENHCNNTCIITIRCGDISLNDIGTFWQLFVSLIMNHQFLSKKKKKLMQILNVKYCINMFKMSISSIDTLKLVSKLLKNALYDQLKVKDLIKKHLCESLKIELDLSWYKEIYEPQFDGLVNELNNDIGNEMISRGKYGGLFIFKLI